MSYRHVRPMAEIGGCDSVADAAGQCPPGHWWQLGDILGAMARSPMLLSHCSVLNCNGKTHPKSPQPHLISTNLPSRGAAVLLIISNVVRAPITPKFQSGSSREIAGD